MESVEKVCTKCAILKNLTEFSARKAKKDGLASWCRECFKSHWQKEYYENHEQYRNNHNASRNNIRKQNAQKVFEYLTKNPCICCGESDPIVLEFDHRDRTTKLENISNLISNGSWQVIEQEIEKCDVLCANCHRRKSAKQFGYKRHLFVNL